MERKIEDKQEMDVSFTFKLLSELLEKAHTEAEKTGFADLVCAAQKPSKTGRNCRKLLKAASS